MSQHPGRHCAIATTDAEIIEFAQELHRQSEVKPPATSPQPIATVAEFLMLQSAIEKAVADALRPPKRQPPAKAATPPPAVKHFITAPAPLDYHLIRAAGKASGDVRLATPISHLLGELKESGITVFVCDRLPPALKQSTGEACVQIGNDVWMSHSNCKWVARECEVSVSVAMRAILGHELGHMDTDDEQVAWDFAEKFCDVRSLCSRSDFRKVKSFCLNTHDL